MLVGKMKVIPIKFGTSAPTPAEDQALVTSALLTPDHFHLSEPLHYKTSVLFYREKPRQFSSFFSAPIKQLVLKCYDIVDASILNKKVRDTRTYVLEGTSPTWLKQDALKKKLVPVSAEKSNYTLFSIVANALRCRLQEKNAPTGPTAKWSYN